MAGYTCVMAVDSPSQDGVAEHTGTVLQHRGLAGRALIWPAHGATEPAIEWFDPHWLAQNDCLRGEAHGRGTTHFIAVDGQELVLRHYRRGGVLRNLLYDRYAWLGLRRSRPWRELAVQTRLHGAGLPVPRPVGALLHHVGGVPPMYRADLLTERLPATQTLAEVLSRARLDRAQWHGIGQVIARFHAAGLEHTDLNAHNLLLDDAGTPTLIDFDRARLHVGPGKWAPANLVRLRRSLDKLAGQRPDFAFGDADWDVLTAGYEAGRRRADASSRTTSMASR